MNAPADYTCISDGNWRVWIRAVSWEPSVWPRLRELVEKSFCERQPHVNRLVVSHSGESIQLLLKLYPAAKGLGQLKDLFRVSRARRYWKQALSLGSYGFLTPLVWAVGERRAWRRLDMAFIVTELVPADSLSHYLWSESASGPPGPSVGAKWAAIRELGRQIGRMHRLGFVHGDLVLSNILLGHEREHVRYYFIDHDRTCRYPRWWPQTLWKRNLIQLNRLVAPGISSRDRIRFFRAYREGRQKNYGPGERKLLRWLERRTIARREETRKPGRELRGPKARDYAELHID